jgi:hypothetical protein
LDAAVNLNKVQLMLLAIEGAGLCLIAMLWMWSLLQRVAAQRYSMLCVFMVRTQFLGVLVYAVDGIVYRL